MVQRRRRRRPLPRDIFGVETARRIRNEGGAGREGIIERNLLAIENATRSRTVPRPPLPSRPTTRSRTVPRPPLPSRPTLRFKRWTSDLKTPFSPKIDAPFNEVLNLQTKKVRDEIKSNIHQREKQVKLTREIRGPQDLDEIFIEFDQKLKGGIKKWLIDNMVNPLKERKASLVEQKNLDPTWVEFNLWAEEDLSNLHRQIEILVFEASKNENNNFLSCFTIDNLPGNQIRALNLLNKILLKSKTATHINDGKIFFCRNGVRIIVDTRITTSSFLDREPSIRTYVGPSHDLVCLQGKVTIPGPDHVVKMILFSDAGWPEEFMPALEGDGKLSLLYQLKKWESREFPLVKNLTYEHYSGMEENIHSIEVYSLKREIIIGTLSKENAAKLIGKGGQKISGLREAIDEKIGKDWTIHVQKLQ